MKTLRMILSVAIPLLLFAAGFWLLRDFDGKSAEALHGFLTIGLNRWLLGILLMLLAVTWALAQVTPDTRKRYLVLDKNDGSVRISLGAVADLLGRLTGEFPWLVSVRPEVRVWGDRLRVDMRCHVKAGTRVPEVSRELQHRVRAVLKQSIGVEDVADVLVTIREIEGAPPPIKDVTPSPTDLDAEPRVAPWVRGPTRTRNESE